MDLKDIPQGAVVAMYGRPGGGKTYTALDMVGRIHHADLDAIAVWFDTDFRMGGNDEEMRQFGIDPARLLVFSVGNIRDVVENFDRVGDFATEGAPIKIIVVNTVTSISRPLDPEEPIGAMTMMLGALAACARKHGITLVLTCHVRQDFGELHARVYKPVPESIRSFVDYTVLVDGAHGMVITKVEHEEKAADV